MNIEEIFKKSGGWYEGHTEFKNGMHGDGWFEKGFIIRHPEVLDEVTGMQSQILIEKFPDVDLLVGPIVSGAVITAFVARHLGKEFAVTTGKGEDIEFHRMHKPNTERKVVLVEDLIFSGTDIRANIKFLKNYGIEVLGVSCWVNRQHDKEEGVRVVSLMKSPFKLYPAKKCPLCMSGVEIKYDSIRE